MNPDGQTAVGAPVPVIGGGDVFATVCPIWSDEEGVRVSIDWHTRLDDLSLSQAVALADGLRWAAEVQPPA